MYETRVLTFGVNTSPGTFLSVVDKAICAGFILKDQVIVNKEMISFSARQMEALGLSNCQQHYTFMNSDTHSEHAISISGALKMVEKIISDNPVDRMDIIEKLRAERRTHASNTIIFCNQKGGQPKASTDDVGTLDSPLASSPTSPPSVAAGDTVFPLSEDSGSALSGSSSI